MSTPVCPIAVRPGERVELFGEFVLRGPIGRRGTVEVVGNVKIGDLTLAEDSSKVIALRVGRLDGGTILIAERFRLPPSMTLHAERAVVSSDLTLPKQTVFDKLKFYCPDIDLRSICFDGMQAEIAPQPDHAIPTNDSVKIFEGTRLQLSAVFGPNVQIGMFERVDIGVLKGHSYLSGPGIVTGNLTVAHISDSTVRAATITIKHADGTLTFFPLTASLRIPPSTNYMFSPDPVYWPKPLDKEDTDDSSTPFPSNSENAYEILPDGPDFIVPDDWGNPRFEYDPDQERQQWMEASRRRSKSNDKQAITIFRLAPDSTSYDYNHGRHSTRVYVENGNLTVENLCRHGVVLHVGVGEVTISNDIFATDNEPQDAPCTTIYAPIINVSSKLLAWKRAQNLILHGAVYVDGKRYPELESWPEGN